MRRFPLLAAVAGVCLLGALAVGSTSASATELCKTAPATHICPSTDRIPVGTKLQAELVPGTTVAAGSPESVLPHCSESKIDMTVAQQGGMKSGPDLVITGWSFGKCVQGPMVAEKVSTIEPYGTIFGGGNTSWISETHSGYQYFNAPQTSVQVGMENLYQTGRVPYCTYNFYVSKITGGSSPQLTFGEWWEGTQNLQVGKNDPRCPRTVQLYGTYNLTTPKPLYVENY